MKSIGKNITIIGQANNIVDSFETAAWRICIDGVDARQKATEGHLVIGGLKAANHSHVVVVVSGLLAHGKYPTAYRGSIGSYAKKMQPLTTLGIKTFEIMLFMLTGGLLYEVFFSHVAIINYFLHTHQ